jgi:hypothetical protein
MDGELFRRRIRSSGLSLWEVGDLLGIHPHDLHSYGPMTYQPVRVVLDLCRRLDLHPADLVDGFDSVLSNQRAVPASAAVGDVSADARTVLTALALSAVPLAAEDLAPALGWALERVAAALDHCTEHADLGGPMALRRLPGDSWSVTARHDLLSAEQEDDLADAVSVRDPMSVNEATVLLAAYAFGWTADYAGWRTDHLEAERHLKHRGLLHSDHGPHRAGPTDEVRFSLRPSADIHIGDR